LAMLAGGLISYMVLDSFGVIYGLESWHREYQRAKAKLINHINTTLTWNQNNVPKQILMEGLLKTLLQKRASMYGQCVLLETETSQ